MRRRHHQGAVSRSRRGRGRQGKRARAQLIGSGAILNEVVKAQALLEKYGVAADVWSATSYNELYRDAHRVERWNLLHPAETADACRTSPSASPRPPGVVVAASDYLKSQPDMISRWVGRPMVTLGTDGFGRSEDRASLAQLLRGRRAAHRGGDAVGAACARSRSTAKVVEQAFKDLEIDADKIDPAIS